MKYVIASYAAVERQGWHPASKDTKEGRVVLNENELLYQYPDKTLEQSAEIVDGVIVSRISALDFITGRKTLNEIEEESKI